MDRRSWILVACALVIVGVMLLAPSLDRLRFEPAKPFAFEPGPTRPFILPSSAILQDAPLWKILAFWLVIVLNLSLLLLLLSPELRRRVLRQMLRVATGVLLFLLLLRYRVLQWPQPDADGMVGNAAIGSSPAPTFTAPVFHPPPPASWLSLAIGVLFFWLLLASGFFAYRLWRRHRDRQLTTVQSLAGIARESLAGLTAGRRWGDVVLEAYARMLEAVQRTRGLERQSAVTPREFSRLLVRTGLPSAAVEELTRLFESVRYGGQPSDPGAGSRAAACLESILQVCEYAG